ncbi:permease [Ruminiclostridium cellulolyticum]|uniref:Permease n=1 Tax=Ruminiclostridium cellulolyticum (strain ATCC 35319 / DSM 5812 / JCM 6584 / H10) TaxID=394503 RepID=B8I8W7_RUMCH|nr:permease [Ruminiclostridium cellulolyticum]ACL77299.1 permease [Ruminiclostridium cellulolyticum H10]
MSIQISIIGGFLESGKTTFVQNLLKSQQSTYGNKTVLICCEQGYEEYRESVLKRYNTTLIYVNDIHILDRGFISSIVEEYAPDRILIEYNGTWPIGDFLRIRLPSGCCISKIVFIADASTFELYMSNMKSLIIEQISNSDVVILNRDKLLGTLEKTNIKRAIKAVNRQAKIIYYKRIIDNKEKVHCFETQGFQKDIRNFLIITLLLVVYFFLISVRNTGFTGDFKKIHTFITVFLSILIQALPFILIGIFISSFLQIFISDEKLVGMFSRFKWAGFPAAVIMGIFFPVCDCAMAPVCSRLAGKGVPLYYVLTFLLSAPVVNPVVITSTYYAFQNKPEVVLMRVGLGIAVALSVGLFVKFAGVSKEYAVKETILDTPCTGGYLGDFSQEGLAGKLGMLIRHAGMEFFNVGSYIVVGAFITSGLQTFISGELFSTAGVSRSMGLLAMLGAAIFMSVCSTSNAFIAKGFSYSFPMYSVVCYMVMGPMLDLKNLLMLSAGFKKKFLIELASILIVIAVFIFSITAPII